MRWALITTKGDARTKATALRAAIENGTYQKPVADPSKLPLADYRAVTTDLFAALRIPLHQGRGFSSVDREGSLPVAVVSRSLANRYWPNADPIGRRIRLANGPWLTVVGVCGDVIQDWFLDRNRAAVYVPYPQAPTGTLVFMLRTSRDPAAVAAQARLAIRAVDPTQPVCLTVWRSTSPGVAPSAIRIPISCRRWITNWAMTL